MVPPLAGISYREKHKTEGGGEGSWKTCDEVGVRGFKERRSFLWCNYCIHYQFCVVDIDECRAGTYKCGVNAVCNNTKGSYICTCKAGYTGDGQTCEGKMTLYFVTCQKNLSATRTLDDTTHVSKLISIYWFMNQKKDQKSIFFECFRYWRVQERPTHLRLKCYL